MLIFYQAMQISLFQPTPAEGRMLPPTTSYLQHPARPTRLPGGEISGTFSPSAEKIGCLNLRRRPVDTALEKYETFALDPALFGEGFDFKKPGS